MDPAAAALAVTLAFVALGYVLFGRPKSGDGGPSLGAGAHCPLGSAVTPSGFCWAIQTAPDLTFLTKDALSALVKGRLTLPVGTPVTVFALNPKYPKSVAMLSGTIAAVHGAAGVADTYDLSITSRDGKGEMPPDEDKPTVPQTIAGVSPLGIVTFVNPDGTVAGGTTGKPPDAGTPFPGGVPTPVFGGFPGGDPAAPVPLDDALATAPTALVPHLPSAAGADVAILHAAVAGVDTLREIPALVISRAHGDLDPRPFTGVVTAAAAKSALGMDFVTGGIYVTFLPDKVFSIRPAVASDLPTLLKIAPGAIKPAAFGGEFGTKTTPPLEF